MNDVGVAEVAVTALLVLPAYLMGVLAAIDVIRRPDIGRIPKAAWLIALVVAVPVTLVYLLARPVGRVGTPESERFGRDDQRVRFTEALERGDVATARELLAEPAGGRAASAPERQRPR